MSKPSIKPHVVLGLSEAQWEELESIAKSHNCPTVSLMLQAVANGTLAIDWMWKWHGVSVVATKPVWAPDKPWEDDKGPWCLSPP